MKRTIIVLFVLAFGISTAHANRNNVNLADAELATAELTQAAVDKIDSLKRNHVIKAPKIDFRCKGGAATVCRDEVMDETEAKIVKIQRLVMDCQRGVSSVNSLNLGHQVRMIVDTIPRNIKLQVIQMSTVTHRTSDSSRVGFCEFDLARTPAFEPKVSK